MTFGLGVKKMEEQISPTWRHKESVDGGLGGTTGEQIRVRLESALKAICKSSAFSCVSFVTRTNIIRIVFSEQNSETTGKGVKFSWKMRKESEKVTLMT